MLGRVVGLDRQEGAGADMERQRLSGNAGGVERFQQLRREMERRGGSGDRAFLLCENRLIVGGVLGIGWAARRDVGR